MDSQCGRRFDIGVQGPDGDRQAFAGQPYCIALKGEVVRLGNKQEDAGSVLYSFRGVRNIQACGGSVCVEDRGVDKRYADRIDEAKHKDNAFEEHLQE